MEGYTQKEPFIYIIGEPGHENCQYYICAETEILKVDSIKCAVFDLFALYYLLDMKYPKNTLALFTFIQCELLRVHREDLKKNVPHALTKLVLQLSSLSLSIINSCFNFSGVQ